MFGCYVQASVTDVSSSYNISEKQKKVYDLLYGKGNWFIDEDGTVAPVKNTDATKDSMRQKLDKFLAKVFTEAGFLGPYSKVVDMIDEVIGGQDKNNPDNLSPQANNYLNKWFSQYDGAIDVGDDGNVTIKADAMQGFRNALSDQVYSLGSYRILGENASKKQIIDFLAKYSEYGALKLSDLFDSPDVFGLVALHDSPRLSYAEVTVLNSKIATEQFFIAHYQFQEKADYNFYIYDYESFSCKRATFITYRSDAGILSSSTSSFRTAYSDSGLYYYGLPIKVFSTTDSAKYYYKCLRGTDYQPDVYIENNYTPSDITFNINNNYNYKDILNNTYNTVNNNKNSAIGENGSITEEELQKIIKDAIDAAIKETGGSNSGSGGSSGGSSGGGSGGSSGGGVSSDLLGSILEYVKKIYTICQTSDSRLETLLKVAQANQETFSDILGAVKDIRVAIDGLGVPLDNIEKYLKSINDKIDELLGSDDSGGSLFDRILDFLSRLTSDLLADLLGDVIKTIIGDLDSVTGPAKALADAAQSKFPTSIPWDIVAIIGVMSADPECPKFEIPFSVPRLGIQETIKIDLSDAEKVAELSRNMLTVTFLLFLVIQTRKLYGSMSKN